MYDVYKWCVLFERIGREFGRAKSEHFGKYTRKKQIKMFLCLKKVKNKKDSYF